MCFSKMRPERDFSCQFSFTGLKMHVTLSGPSFSGLVLPGLAFSASPAIGPTSHACHLTRHLVSIGHSFHLFRLDNMITDRQTDRPTDQRRDYIKTCFFFGDRL